jgi:hypothetical protein
MSHIFRNEVKSSHKDYGRKTQKSRRPCMVLYTWVSLLEDFDRDMNGVRVIVIYKGLGWVGLCVCEKKP